MSVNLAVVSTRRYAMTGYTNTTISHEAGDFYVDHTCIDCDTCRWMAPATFTRVGGKSAVFEQPTTHEARVVALQALLSCPTYSIHVGHKSKEELRDAQEGLPAPVAGLPGIFLNGWTSVNSYAAASYIIQRPDGNIMVDCPRFSPVLARQIEKLGGVKYMFLTHKDDVCDHDKWQRLFGASRILHSDEVTSGTQGVEMKLRGEGPWRWRDVVAGRCDTDPAREDAADLSAHGDEADIELVFTPGHTKGHVCMYYGPQKVLFSGDHLSAPADHPTEGQLVIFDDVNWYSIPRQVESVQKLLQYDFLHVLPGHGRAAHFRDAMGRLKAMNELLRQHSAGGTVKHYRAEAYS